MKAFRFAALLGLVGWMGIATLHADEPAAPAPVTDTARVAEHYRQVVAQPEFQEIVEPDFNARLKELLSQWFTRLGVRFGEFKYANQMPIFASLLMTLLVVFSISSLLYIIVRLTRRRGGRDPEPSAGEPGQKVFRPPEFYDKEIQEAIEAGDWHGAWLATWRQFLSRLENRQLVEVDRTRTNREYLVQLGAQNLPAAALSLLTEMVDAYDRFIYGRKLIAETDWHRFHQQMDEAGLMLHLEDRPRARRTQKEGS